MSSTLHCFNQSKYILYYNKLSFIIEKINCSKLQYNMAFSSGLFVSYRAHSVLRHCLLYWGPCSPRQCTRQYLVRIMMPSRGFTKNRFRFYLADWNKLYPYGKKKVQSSCSVVVKRQKLNFQLKDLQVCILCKVSGARVWAKRD